jgi:hypothetical protein
MRNVTGVLVTPRHRHPRQSVCWKQWEPAHSETA